MNELVMKVCVVGEGGTGKTSMLHRLVKDEFISDMKMTIGTGLMTHSIEVDSQKIIYQLWDFAGENRFRFFLPNYLKGAKAVILCYDMTRFPTFNNLNEWYSIVESNIDLSKMVVYLVGNKKDLKQKKAVFSETVDEWKDKRKIDRTWTSSALTGENIDEIYQTLGKDLIEKRDEL